MNFNDYANNAQSGKDNRPDDIMSFVTGIAEKYNGKSQTELMRAVYEEAKRGKQNGTLTNADIDRFVSVLSPLVDDKMRKTLLRVAAELKKI